MPVNPAYEGRVYPPSSTYLVGREHIRAFAAAVGATDPVHHDVEAARAAGFRDLIAPPTFPVVLGQRCEWQYFSDPGSGVDYSRAVHGEENFVHHRPLTAGDEIVSVLHIDRVREVRGNAMIATRVELTTPDGTAVTTVTSSLIVRAEES